MRRSVVFAVALGALWCGLPPAVAAQGDRLVVLVRHAEADGEPRQDPPLTDRGRARAEALAAALEHANIQRIVVSPLARTRLTAEPIARARGVPPTVADVAGGLDAHVAAVVDAVRSGHADGAVLVVGHSNTVPAIVTALGAPPMPDLCHGEFATLFVLHLPAEGTPWLIRSSYGAPDEEDACETAN
jgi:broad specificity phosphatase PhoE